MIQRGQLQVVQGGQATARAVPPPDDRPPRKPIPVIPPPSYGWLWLTLGVIASLLVHGVIVYIAIKAPALLRQREDTIVRMFVVEQAPPEPEVEEEEATEAPAEEPEEVDYQDAVVAEAPPPDALPQEQEPAKPVFGVSMNSTVAEGGSWGLTVGNTVGIDPEDSADPEELVDDGAPTVKYEYIDREPVVTRRHQPPYPAASKEAGIEGDVVLYLTIDENGDVADAAVVSGPNKELNDAARAAMFKHRFRPATQGGKPVVVTRYPYIFTWIIEE